MNSKNSLGCVWNNKKHLFVKNLGVFRTSDSRASDLWVSPASPLASPVEVPEAPVSAVEVSSPEHLAAAALGSDDDHRIYLPFKKN